jgi:PAS domain S-box-containing protein
MPPEARAQAMVPNRQFVDKFANQAGPSAPELRSPELSEEWRAEFLNPHHWVQALQTYADTTKLAVALTDPQGHLLGECLNPQPTWSVAQKSPRASEGGCPFCLAPSAPCTAVVDALRTGEVVMTQDGAGLAHVAVPLSLRGRQLGALIAGQVLNRYPEPLPLQRVARLYGVSPQHLWHHATQQVPITKATLMTFGRLLKSLADAHLGQGHATLLQTDLAAMNLRYRLLIDGMQDYALYAIDRARRIVGWNSGAEKMFGYSEAEIMGCDCSCLFVPEDTRNEAIRPTLQEADRQGWVESEGWRVRKDGTRFFATAVIASLARGAVREYGMLVRDVTELRRSAEAVRQAQKLESIGVLASGIAHDFNNLLAGIVLGVAQAKSSLPPDHSALADLEVVEHCSQRAAELTTQLLAYAGKGQFVITRFDLSALVAEMLPLIGASISKAVQLELFLTPELPWIEGDASQIRQIVMNLIINGAEAVGDGGGIVRISTGITHHPRSAGEVVAAAEKVGTDVYMEVKDSGPGMNDATKARIFDPFFTTKVAGRGLGLAAVAGIIRGHMGRVGVESVPGEGTTFTVFFPAVERLVPHAVETPPFVVAHGAGTLLFVDDEPSLRRLGKQILEESGYTVLVAENGREAVEIFQHNASKIATVLMDMAMPVMGGNEAFRLMRKIRPDVPIILMSGCSESSAREDVGASELTDFIQKPYSLALLVATVRASIEKQLGEREADSRRFDPSM